MNEELLEVYAYIKKLVDSGKTREYDLSKLVSTKYKKSIEESMVIVMRYKLNIKEINNRILGIEVN